MCLKEYFLITYSVILAVICLDVANISRITGTSRPWPVIGLSDERKGVRMRVILFLGIR